MLRGHYWTIRHHFESRLRPASLPASRAWFCETPDALLGRVRLSGRLCLVPGCDTLLVIVHGLGGSSQSSYTFHAAAAARSAGVSSLRLNLRGADLRGEDFFHAGLASDIDVALSSPELAAIRSVLLLGYSLGGHVCLCAAARSKDPRIHAVAALCAPLDLAASCRAFDAPARTVYRRHVLNGLKQMYRSFVAKHPEHAPVSLHCAQRVAYMRQWDELVVAPRFGFVDAEEYYTTQSASRCLSDVGIPALLVHSTLDPMVPVESVRPFYERAQRSLRIVELDRGGHVGFPTDIALGLGRAGTLEAQVVQWLLSQRGLEAVGKAT